MRQTLEVQGSDEYVRFKENRDSTSPSEEIGSAASKEVLLAWTIYGRKVLECEVWVVEEAEGGYSAFAAHLPGVVAQSEERDLALFEIERALGAVISSYLERAETIPWTEDPIELATDKPILKQWILLNA